jgi:hypothetical protein
MCLDDESVDIEAHDTSWFLDIWRNKTSLLNIAKLRINQKSNGPARPVLPKIASPDNLPRIPVDSLTPQSYFLHQPLNLVLKKVSLLTSGYPTMSTLF